MSTFFLDKNKDCINLLKKTFILSHLYTLSNIKIFFIILPNCYYLYFIFNTSSYKKRRTIQIILRFDYSIIGVDYFDFFERRSSLALFAIDSVSRTEKLIPARLPNLSAHFGIVSVFLINSVSFKYFATSTRINVANE
jgi:hypothetical protein